MSGSSGMCETPGCGKPASMACPTCVKLGLPKSVFCSQECFKGYWPKHKSLHSMAQHMLKKKQTVDIFSGFKFTGDLRPARVTPKRAMPPAIKRPDYADHPQGRSECEEGSKKFAGGVGIPIYTAEEIEGIRGACRVGREVLDIAGRAVKAGVTTDEIDRIVHEACIERNAYPSPLNYYEFPKSVCTSVNEAICHGIPDERELVDGDIVNIDVTTYVGGYHGDLNETFLVGEVDPKAKDLVKTAFECLATAVSMVRPGTLYCDLGSAITKRARAGGCQVVKTYCGHGIGSLFHTVPNIPHYAKNKAKGVMKAGHIFTIEPMINLGTWRDVTWPDNWTAVTEDGSLSAQFEHTILVTETGYELLTGRTDEPVMGWSEEKLQR